jgi:hypothetical protein
MDVNVTLWPVRLTIVAVETRRCILRFPTHVISFKRYGGGGGGNLLKLRVLIFCTNFCGTFPILRTPRFFGRDRSVGIATGYGMDGSEIESQ